MSFQEDSEDGGEVKRPLLHQRSWHINSRISIGRGDSYKSEGSKVSSQESSAIAVLCTVVVALGPLQYGFTNGYSSPTQSSIMSDLNLTVSEALLVASIPNILGWVAISYAKTTSLLYIGRLLTGLGVGIISFTVPVYIAEIAPKHLRGGLGTVNMLSVIIGIFVAYLLGMFVTWRHLAIAGIIPCSLLVLGLFVIPEAPRWLAKIGNDMDFEASLQTLRGFDSDISLEATEIRSATEVNRQESSITLLELCQRRFAFPLTIGIGLLVLQQLTGVSGVMFYNTSILKSAGISDAEAASVGLAGVQILMIGCIVWLMDTAGRRLLLVVSSAGMAISLFVIVVAFYLKNHTASTSNFASILAVAGLLGYIISYSLGMGAIPWIIMSEILPTNVKGIGGSVATLANWFFSWTVTMTFNLLLEWSKTGTFMVYCLLTVLTLIFVVLWVPETKGRTLEEIEASHT